MSEASGEAGSSGSQWPNGGVARWSLGLDQLLKDPAGAAAFAAFLRGEYAHENLAFWYSCENYVRASSDDARELLAREIWERHLVEGAPEPVNIDAAARRATVSRINEFPPPPDLFSQKMYTPNTTSGKSREEDHQDNNESSDEMDSRSSSRTGRRNSDANLRIPQTPVLSHTDRPFERATHSRMNCPGQQYINQNNSLPPPWSVVMEVHLVCRECRSCYRAGQQTWTMFPPAIITPTKAFPERTVHFESLPVELPHQGNTLKSCIKHQALSSPGRQQTETSYYGQIQPGRWRSNTLDSMSQTDKTNQMQSSNGTSQLCQSRTMNNIASQTDPICEVSAGLNPSQKITNTLDNPQPGTSRGSSSESGKLGPFDRNQQLAPRTLHSNFTAEARIEVCNKAQRQIYNMMRLDLYPRFLRSGVHAECARADLRGMPPPYSAPATTDQSPSTPSKLKKSASNASERRRSGGGSLLPWRIRVPSRDRTSSAAAAGDLPVHAAAAGSAGPALARQPGTGHPAPATAAPSPPANVPGETSCLHLSDVVKSGALCRVVLPDGATSVVGVDQALPVRRLVDRLLARRNLLASVANYDVLLKDARQGEPPVIDGGAPSTALGGREVLVERRCVVRLEVGGRCVAVRCRPLRQLRHVLKPVLARYGGNVTRAHVLRDGAPLHPDTPMQELDGARLQVVEVSETRPEGTPDEDTESLSELAVRLADAPDTPEEAPVGRVRAALKPGPPLHHHPPDFLDNLRDTQRSRLASKSEPTPTQRAPPPLPPKPLPAKPLPAKPIPAKPIPEKPIPAKPIPEKPIPAKPIPAKPIPAKSILQLSRQPTFV